MCDQEDEKTAHECYLPVANGGCVTKEAKMNFLENKCGTSLLCYTGCRGRVLALHCPTVRVVQHWAGVCVCVSSWVVVYERRQR